jgi:hypothetical protein
LFNVNVLSTTKNKEREKSKTAHVLTILQSTVCRYPAINLHPEVPKDRPADRAKTRQKNKSKATTAELRFLQKKKKEKRVTRACDRLSHWKERKKRACFFFQTHIHPFLRLLADQRMSKELNELQNATVGMTVGVIEVCIARFDAKMRFR